MSKEQENNYYLNLLESIERVIKYAKSPILYRGYYIDSKYETYLDKELLVENLIFNKDDLIKNTLELESQLGLILSACNNNDDREAIKKLLAIIRKVKIAFMPNSYLNYLDALYIYDDKFVIPYSDIVSFRENYDVIAKYYPQKLSDLSKETATAMLKYPNKNMRNEQRSRIEKWLRDHQNPLEAPKEETISRMAPPVIDLENNDNKDYLDYLNILKTLRDKYHEEGDPIYVFFDGLYENALKAGTINNELYEKLKEGKGR